MAALRPEIDAAVARVLDSGWFILGPEGEAFERELAASLAARHAVAVANGTEAIQLALEALGLPPATRSSPRPSPPPSPPSPSCARGRGRCSRTGPRDPQRHAGDGGRALTPHTRALLPVHLYGHPVDLDPMIEMARDRGIPLVEDACQAIGAQYKGRPVGAISGIGALSFYPTKNLGAFGDGGAVVVEDPEIATRLRRLRNGGQSDRYRHEVAGINSRLDEMQAALLRVKLGHLAAWTDRRRGPGRALRRGPARRGRGDSGRAAVCARGLPPLRDPPSPARRPGRRAEGARDRDPRPLPHPAAPAARLRGAREEARGLPGGGARGGRDPLHPLFPEMTDDQAEAVIRAIREVAPGLR